MRTGLVRSMYERASVGKRMRRFKTYDYGVDKRGPALALFEQCEYEGYGSRTEQDQDQLILELLENELP